jgi:crotonobetaine/carnitine-CoA ligase
VSGSFAAIIDRRVSDSADRPFLTCGDKTITYGEFAGRLERLAGALVELGIRKGDKICLYLPNGLPFVLMMFAAARLGAVFVPAHPQFTARELRYVLQHAEAVLAVTDDERLGVLSEARTECPLVRDVIVAESLDSLLARATAGDVRETVDEGDPVAIMYTSGTTGLPKGAVLTHRGYTMNARAFAERTLLSRNDVLFCVLPLAHLNAQRSSLLPTALVGARLILAERFGAGGFWPAVRAAGVTFFSIMPAIVSILLRQEPSANDREHRVRLCVTPITPPLLEAFEQRFGIPVVNTYGLTEGMMNVMNFVDEGRRREAVGKPLLPDVHHIRIVDENDEPLAAGETGEIVLRSPAMMTGYYRDPEATARALRGGWLHTGDLGYLDEEGFLYFSGRKKEMIRRAGENIAPGEIETVLAEHPAVQEAVVVGVADPVREEEVKACIILREGQDEVRTPPTSIIDYCAQRLAAFKVPRYLEYRHDFPRTPATLRVRRGELQTLSPAKGTRLYDRMDDRWIESR